MPELPEVEVVRRGLAAHLVGARIHQVEVHQPRVVRRHDGGAPDFVRRLTGRRVRAAHRRGKFLWLPLDDDQVLFAHLGMSGQLLVQPPHAPAEPHLRTVLHLDRPTQVRYVDQRMFGGLWLGAPGGCAGDGARRAAPDALPDALAHIAPDPLDPGLEQRELARRLRRRRTTIKRALLDQTVVSGVGNIYADEALWRARVHGQRRCAGLRLTDAQAVLEAVKAVLLAALDQGGTSFDALYVNVDGDRGYFARSLQVYGRAGLPCARCGAAIVREPFANRSSYVCPQCQPRSRRRRPGVTRRN